MKSFTEEVNLTSAKFVENASYFLLFAIYVNDLIVKLRELKVGCHISDEFLPALVYADKQLHIFCFIHV